MVSEGCPGQKNIQTTLQLPDVQPVQFGSPAIINCTPLRQGIKSITVIDQQVVFSTEVHRDIQVGQLMDTNRNEEDLDLESSKLMTTTMRR